MKHAQTLQTVSDADNAKAKLYRLEAQRRMEIDAANTAFHNLQIENTRLRAALKDLMASCQKWAPTIDRSRARAALGGGE